MSNDWIIEVLSDLKRYAAANGLPKLAEAMDEMTLLAATEIAAAAEPAKREKAASRA